MRRCQVWTRRACTDIHCFEKTEDPSKSWEDLKEKDSRYPKRRELVVCDRTRKSLADFRRIRPEMCVLCGQLKRSRRGPIPTKRIMIRKWRGKDSCVHHDVLGIGWFFLFFDGSRQNQVKPHAGTDGFLYHTRLGFVGWITYWCLGDSALSVDIIVALIKTLGLRLWWGSSKRLNQTSGDACRLASFGHRRRRGRCVLDTSDCWSSARFREATAP